MTAAKQTKASPLRPIIINYREWAPNLKIECGKWLFAFETPLGRKSIEE